MAEQLRFRLGEALGELRARAAAAGEEVPDDGALARAAGVSRRTLQRLIAGDTMHVDLRTLGAILTELHRSGHALAVEEVFVYEGE